MNREEVYKRLNKVFQDVFDDDLIIINESISSSDIEDWDSMMHIILISGIEEEFNIKFSMTEVGQLKSVSQIIERIINS